MGHMEYALTQPQTEQYGRDGYLSPLNIFSEAEVRAFRTAFERFERSHGDLAAGLRTDLHLLEKWAWQAVTDRRVIDPVVSVLGENVLLWSMNWFIKEAHDGKYVSMHQDANYWGLEPHDICTAWIAVSDATPAAGPMFFLPGSHRGELYTHENTFAQDNLLTRGQVAQTDVNDDDTKLAPLNAGQMSLHHVRILHGSDANSSSDRRIGMVLRFCATHVRQTKGADTAVLVNGVDSYGNFDLLPQPSEDNGQQEQRRHEDAVQKMSRLIMMD